MKRFNFATTQYSNVSSNALVKTVCEKGGDNFTKDGNR